MKGLSVCVLAVFLLAVSVAGCAPTAAPSATTAPAKPAAQAPAAQAPTAAAKPAAAAPTTAPAKAAPAPTAAEKVSFAGKSIRIVSSGSAGSSIDTVARFLALVLPKYIPGQPEVIVQAVPGGSGVVAMNSVYNTAKPDGLTILAGTRSEALPQLLKDPGVQYDISKLRWIGSTNTVSNGIFVRSALAKSIPDLQKLSKPLNVGATGRGGAIHIGFAIAEKVFNIPAKYAFGYTSSPDVPLAFERGEIDAFGGAIRVLANMGTTKEAIEAGRMTIVAQTGKERDPLFKDVPSVYEYLKLPGVASNAQDILDVLGVQDLTGKYYALPPKTPDPVVATLRQALWEAMHDPEFVSRIEQAKQDYNPQRGEQIQSLLERVLNLPPSAIEILKSVVAGD